MTTNIAFVRSIALVAITVSMLGGCPIASANDGGFCILPVKGGTPGEADVGQTWRITDNVFQIPGLPGPVYTPINRQGQWTIDSNHRLVPYDGLYPHTYLDQAHWVIEPWSSRVVAITYGGGVSIIHAGNHHFEAIDDVASGPIGGFAGIYLLPRRHLTIAVLHDGTPWIVGERSLSPWLSQQELAGHDVHGIYSVYDAPSLSATVVLDLDRRLHVLSDDGRWQQVAAVSADDDGRLVDLPRSGAAVFLAYKSVIAIRKSQSPGPSGFTAETIATASGISHGRDQVQISNLFGQALSYSGAGFFDARARWRRLDPHGYVDIPGGDVGIPQSGIFPNGHIQDLPTISRTLIYGRAGLFLYDGAKIVPVVNGAKSQIGDLFEVYDLGSIDKVIVTTHAGMFELTRAGELVGLPVPFPTDGTWMAKVADWPGAGAALISTRSGIFSLGRNLLATPMPGGDQIDLGGLGFTSGIIPGTGDLVLSGSRGIFLAIAPRKSGDDPCQEMLNNRKKTPDSDICLKPVSGTGSDAIGFSVGDLIEAPGGDGVLFDSVRGLFHLSTTGVVTLLQPRNGQYTRSLAALPWSDEVIAGGVIDTVVRRNLSLKEVSRHNFSQLLGVFPSIRAAMIVADSSSGQILLVRFEDEDYRTISTKLTRNKLEVIVDAPWFGAPVVVSGSRLFTLDREGALSPFAIVGSAQDAPLMNHSAFYSSLHGISDFFAVPRFETIYSRSNGWFRITRDRKYLPVRGLPSDASVTQTFDPGSGDVLFGTTVGIFAVDMDGVARRVNGDGGPSGVIRAFGAVSGSNHVMAGGDEGLFDIDLDSLRASPVSEGSAEIIGSVSDIVGAATANLLIVEASAGTYAFESGALRLVRELSAASGESSVRAFPHLHRMFVVKWDDPNAMLRELGRRNSKGECTNSLYVAKP